MRVATRSFFLRQRLARTSLVNDYLFISLFKTIDLEFFEPRTDSSKNRSEFNFRSNVTAEGRSMLRVRMTVENIQYWGKFSD